MYPIPDPASRNQKCKSEYKENYKPFWIKKRNYWRIFTKQNKECNMEHPGVKTNMRLKKHQLVIKARNYNISTDGKTKVQLSREISNAESKESTRIWREISK